MRYREGEENTALMPVSEASERLGVSKSTVYRMMTEGTLPQVLIGKMRWIPRDAFNVLVKSWNDVNILTVKVCAS